MFHGGGNAIRGFNSGVMANGHNAGWLGLLPIAFHVICFIVIVVLAVIFLRRHRSKDMIHQKQNDPALRILRERYASGDIDTEEFERRKQDLTN